MTFSRSCDLSIDLLLRDLRVGREYRGLLVQRSRTSGSVVAYDTDEEELVSAEAGGITS